MIYTIKLKNKDKFIRTVIDLFDFMAPFCNVENRERDVFAELITGYIEYKSQGLTDEEVYNIIFGYEYRRKISYSIKRGDKNISMDVVNNYLSRLRKKGVLLNNTIVDKYLRLFTIANSEKEFTFVFEFNS